MPAGGKPNRVRRELKRDFPDHSSREDDRDKGNQTTKRGRIESNGRMEYGSATAEGEQSLPRGSDVRDTDPRAGTHTDSEFMIADLPAQWDDYQLYHLTKFYRDRLEQAIEEKVEKLGLVLRKEGYFSREENEEITEMAENGNRRKSSRHFLELMMEKGSRTQRLMWESFVKMRTELPKLGEILKEIQELGPDPQECMNIALGLSELPTQLKDPVSTNSDLLAQVDEYRLCQLTKFYPDRLKQAIKDGVELFSLMLRKEGYFSGQEHAQVIELAKKGNQAESSAFFVNLVMRKDSQTRKAMWESFEKMRTKLPKLDKILKELQELDVQQEHRETLRAQTETLKVKTILVREKEKVLQLVDQYVELTLVSTVRDRRLVEHELRARGRDHEEKRQEHLRGELEKLRLDQLFQSSCSQSETKSGRSAAVAGGPGIGKTTMVQKIVYDWATEKIYQQFQFVFSFKFRDLNSIDCSKSLTELILDQYRHFGNLLGEVWKNPEGLLFIFDGLDEFKHRIDFAERRGDTEPQYTCTDPEFRCSVSDIVYSLIQGKLLPGCSVLVTTRPSELRLLEKAEISVRAEILGFVGKERKKYFIKYFKVQKVVAAVLKRMEENEILYTMSYNPSYCLTLALALESCFTQGDGDPQQVPATVTQLYSYYICNILKNHSCEIAKRRDPLLRVGQMAYRGVSQRKAVFTDGDMNICNVQPSEFLSAFLTELSDNPWGVVYTFAHLIIQEFVAALAQLLALDSRDTRKFLTDAYHTSDGRFEMLLRFIVGLSSPVRARDLENLLGPFPRETTGQVCEWLKEEVKRQSENTGNEDGKRLLNILHFLFESQDPGLAQDLLESVKEFSFTEITLTPMDCMVMSYFIEHCDTIKFLALSHCHIQYEGLQILGPRLHKIQNLRLVENDLGDSGVKLVSEALRNPKCRIMKLWLGDVGLTDSGVKDLASTLSTNQSLMELNLSHNELRYPGVKSVSDALKNPECKLQILVLNHVGLTESGVKDLASSLCTNRSLTVLDLSDNKLGDSGVKLVSAALRNPECKIQRLGLNRVSLTESGAEDLASTLCTNRSLTDLDLNDNKLRDSGVKLLSEALRNPECKLEKLGLWDVGFTDSGAKDLFSALRTNRSLTWLNLGANKLRDSGMKLGSLSLRNPECQIQRLELFCVGLTDSGVEDLASALSTMQSLTVLNLGLNSLTDRSVSALRRLVQTLTSLQCLKLDGNQFDRTRKKELRSLEGPKGRLIVSL